MSKKSGLSYTDRQQLEHLTSRLGPTASPRQRERVNSEIEQLLQGKQLTNQDLALAAYYVGNVDRSTEGQQTAQALAAAYRGGYQEGGQ
ncbi:MULTISPECIES: hypothetical protein [unclassified Pseudomonas]|uniref:hypothetical protein n=1 Tax=unclassified Pseudomonas TaxID=196821 RepID=UPI00131D1D61|nr:MULTISPECIES: hypothetical protein [unclassified Pseudomonas]